MEVANSLVVKCRSIAGVAAVMQQLLVLLAATAATSSIHPAAVSRLFSDNSSGVDFGNAVAEDCSCRAVFWVQNKEREACLYSALLLLLLSTHAVTLSRAFL